MDNEIISQILDDIWRYGNEERVPFLERALQIKYGGYGYGDSLCGTKIPILRKIAKKYTSISLETIELLLQDELHEARFTALVMLIEKSRKLLKETLSIYLRNIPHINNWDLVDISARWIIGKFCTINQNQTTIWDLAKSDNLWANRMAIVSSFEFIKNNHFDLTFKLCMHFKTHKHHIIHKACGWMLREIRKKNEEKAISFIQENERSFPRIITRYAMEEIRKRRC